MNSGLNVRDPVVVAAFKAALLHQALFAVLIFGVLGAVWAVRQARRPGRAADRRGGTLPEPTARQLLAIGFGNLWLLDGILQAQPNMAIGLPSLVVEPTASSSPAWVQHLANWAATAWSYHPVQAAAAVVWIQVGIGLWLLTAPRGIMSRLAGLVSVGWGLVVWVFGESFGGIFAPGLSWLTGAPGAATVYVAAGILLALPERAWHSPRLGRLTLTGLGLFLAGLAVLQAWPGRGFWAGISHGQPGVLAGMARSMSVTPQPGFLSGWLLDFAAFDEAHGFAVNVAAVVVLAVTGAVFLTGRRWLIRPVLIGFTVFCLADWVLVQDMGVFGGVGTDPNSMIPFILLAGAGYLAIARPGEPAAGPSPAAVAEPAPAGTATSRGSWPPRPRIAPWRWLVTASGRSVTAVGASCLIVLGAVPMALAQASPGADPILAESIAGRPVPINHLAPGFTLTDQYGRAVTLAALRGQVLLLSFCMTRCGVVGQELRETAQLLAGSTRQIELAGITIGPGYQAASTASAFGRQPEPDWLSLTGPPGPLQQLWHQYRGVTQELAGRAIRPHSGEMFVISGTGRIRQAYSTDAGPATAVITSSFAVLFADAARQALGRS